MTHCGHKPGRNPAAQQSPAAPDVLSLFMQTDRLGRRLRSSLLVAPALGEGAPMFDRKRRKFITLVGGAAMWPLAARAQQRNRVRRIGILMAYPKGDPELTMRLQAFRQELAKLGWTEGVNVQLDERWTADDMDRVRSEAASLVKSNPDAILATGGRVIPVLLQLSRTIPIVAPGASGPLAVEPIGLPIHGLADIERAMDSFADRQNTGVSFPSDLTTVPMRNEIVALMARHHLPAIYSDPTFVSAGGLAFYGSDRVDQFRGAAGYVDRILRGENPGDLPFQQPTKYQFIVNLKTAKAMGLGLSP